jgi:hypothetical protein
MKKPNKGGKQHFELSPANSKRLDAYLDRFNEDPKRVTPRLKIGDVVNRALDEWFSEPLGEVLPEGGADDAEKAR